jgi:hypothetical protein
MKTQCIHIDQALSGINNLVVTNITNLKWHKLIGTLKFSPGKLSHYFLPLLKQLFRDNFMGSEMEMGILLLFVKSYFLLAVYAIRHNALTDRVKKLNKSINESVELNHEVIYQHKQAA